MPIIRCLCACVYLTYSLVVFLLWRISIALLIRKICGKTYLPFNRIHYTHTDIHTSGIIIGIVYIQSNRYTRRAKAMMRRTTIQLEVHLYRNQQSRFFFFVCQWPFVRFLVDFLICCMNVASYELFDMARGVRFVLLAWAAINLIRFSCRMNLSTQTNSKPFVFESIWTYSISISFCWSNMNKEPMDFRSLWILLKVGDMVNINRFIGLNGLTWKYDNKHIAIKERPNKPFVDYGMSDKTLAKFHPIQKHEWYWYLLTHG